MKVVISILNTELDLNGVNYQIKYQMNTDLEQELISDLALDATLTDAAINQAIIDDAIANLEVAAGTAFVVGDKVTIRNSFTSTTFSIITATLQSVIDTPSLETDLNTLLTAEGLI